MKFSVRKGYKKISDIIQTDSINDQLRISLWNGKLEKKVSQFLRCKLLQVILNNL
jgi:hypothetical protein